MSRDPQRLRDYLGHIAEAIGRIQRYTGSMDEAAFAANALVQDAVIRNLEIIGEASRNIERGFPEFAKSHPELPLAAANDMRNVLAHGYFRVDLQIVWRTIQIELPGLHARVTQLESALGSGEGLGER
jgi:uncharacterized protein with HEPN domain